LLIELGAGFAFVARQVPLDVDGQDFFLDLLFYHLHLRCFIVIDFEGRQFQARIRREDEFLSLRRR
jgi:predicted nuclease of restriction endonuclease-like (RecB) superfamily